MPKESDIGCCPIIIDLLESKAQPERYGNERIIPDNPLIIRHAALGLLDRDYLQGHLSAQAFQGIPVRPGRIPGIPGTTISEGIDVAKWFVLIVL